MDNLYILKHRKPVFCDDLLKWGKWFEKTNKRKVRRTYLDDICISTVFLRVDHGWDGKILLFETMIFDEKDERYCERCETWRQALAMHWQAVSEYKSEKKA